MKRMKWKNNSLEFMIKPILFLSVISIVFYILKLIGAPNADNLYSASVIIIVLSALFCNIKNKRKTLIILLLFVFLITVYIFFYDKIVKMLIQFSSGSAVKFSMINTIFNTFGFFDFQNYADYTSYGGSVIIDNDIVNGAVNIFMHNKSSKAVSQFLTSRFLMNFSVCAIAFAVGRKNFLICLIALISLFTGCLTPLLLLFVCVFPVCYLISLLASFASGLISFVIGIKFGFVCSPSIFELFIHNSNRIYSLVVCVLVFCVSYYFASLVKEKLI